MAQEIDINLNVNAEQADKSLGSLKSQLREAQAEVQTLSDKFGATSKEAVEAAKAAAVLKDKIGDAKSLTEAFNPDAKFKSLSGSLTGVAGGFSVVTGAMGAFGGKSKAVEESLLKVQSAMAMASGLQAVGQSIDSFKQLGSVVKSYTIVQNISAAAQKLWNAAMASNPIGAIVVVVTALIAAGYALVNMFIASSSAAKKAELANKALANEIKNNKKEQDRANETFQASRDHQLGMAKASGKSAEEIRKLTLQLAKQEVQQNATNYQTNRAIALEARRIASSEDATDAEKKTAEEATKLSNESTKALEQSVKNRREIESQNAIARQQEQTDAYKESLEKQKKAGEDAANTSKENAKKLAEEKLKQEQEEKDALTKKYRDAEAKADDFYAAEKKAREGNLKATMSAQDAELETLQESYAEKLKYAQENGMSSIELQSELLRKENEIKKKFKNEAIAKEDEQWLRLQELTLEKSEYEALVRQQKFEAEYTAAEGNAKLQIALKNQYLEKEKNIEIANAKVVADAKVAIQQGVLDALGGLVGLAKSIGEKNKGLQKAALVAETAIGIANVIIGTNAGAAKEVATKGIFGLSTATVLYAKMGISIAAILAASAKGFSALGGGGGGASGGGGGAGGGAAAAPSFNIVGPSGANQIAESIGNKETQPLKAFVVGGDVTSQQSLNRGIVENATLG